MVILVSLAVAHAARSVARSSAPAWDERAPSRAAHRAGSAVLWEAVDAGACWATLIAAAFEIGSETALGYVLFAAPEGRHGRWEVQQWADGARLLKDGRLPVFRAWSDGYNRFLDRKVEEAKLRDERAKRRDRHERYLRALDAAVKAARAGTTLWFQDGQRGGVIDVAGVYVSAQTVAARLGVDPPPMAETLEFVPWCPLPAGTYLPRKMRGDTVSEYYYSAASE